VDVSAGGVYAGADVVAGGVYAAAAGVLGAGVLDVEVDGSTGATYAGAGLEDVVGSGIEVDTGAGAT